MAIWPFGRKSKRHTIQLDAGAVEDAHLAQEQRHSLDNTKLGRKPSRKQSKRQKNRHSNPAGDLSTSLSEASPPSQPTRLLPPTSDNEQVGPMREARDQPSRIGSRRDGHASRSTIGQDHTPSIARNASLLLKSKRNDNGPAVLKKKLSKRKAYEIAREREIRLMASSPIDIPHRSTQPGDNLSVDTRRPPRTHSRRSDRHQSDLSLSLRDSTSSLSDFADSYTFKVNGFSAWTPRPVIRYVEAPRLQTAKSQKTSEGSTRKEKTPAVSVSEETGYSKKRVDRLADDLDAGALRELLERDRRRKERKQIEDQEKLQRRLQRTAERQRLEAERESASRVQQDEKEDSAQVQRGRPGAEDQAEADRAGDDAASKANEMAVVRSGDPAGSWLRDASKEAHRHVRASTESVNVIGNIDDSSIREPKLGMRRSFAPSQEMGMSRSTLHSPSSSQVGMGRESTSDLSRTVDSERRLSDNGSGRMNTISSIFRRGSSRLKRRYRERFHDRGSEISNNTSHESFFKVSTQSSGPPPYVPPKTFLHSGTIKRSQSKFTEHFGDEPLSPPDSRLQSPDIPEEPLEVENDQSTAHIGSQYPIPGSDVDLPDANGNHHNSWTGESMEGDAENVPLSQSLASIDSEGSWMSGQFLRRISQRTNNPVRPSLSSSRRRLDEGNEEPPKQDEVATNGDELVKFSTNNDETFRASHAVSEHDHDFDMAQAPAPAEENWHDHVARRPVLVTPAIRPKSNEGILNSVIADEEFSPIEEHSAEYHFAKDDGYDSGHGH
ncbi:hypothetical protein P170DRAFT_362517 [Aspergillus steynii IBT 23096]|uniref:Uncharacterized protein n=1 Tax=Aspergillus steynii IBT 23096 TaxID=1392250 RepID=A0A2I2G2W4_9EURO|nr:uncharacterized protein P170DRAFT_362517 [Aspergillus steynii IBT 23096]PLB47224.1 hypothetical protein P170DRAFT_362517 [Aspergillus steynii IBT 23096]